MIRKALTTAMLALSLAALSTVPAHAVPIDLTEDAWVFNVLLTAFGYADEEEDAGGYNLEVPTAGDILETDEEPEVKPGPVFGSL